MDCTSLLPILPLLNPLPNLHQSCRTMVLEVPRTKPQELIYCVEIPQTIIAVPHRPDKT
jgi:hypothetical protein